MTATNRQTLELGHPKQIREVIRSVRPTLIVNVAAYTAVDQAKGEPVRAKAVNSDAPRIMAKEAKAMGAALIHYSTNYVFDGTSCEPYGETDATNPLTVYGRSNLQGEQEIEPSGVSYLIFRTAWIYSLRGKNFLLTVLRLAQEREELHIVNDQRGAPTWSRALAAATAAVLNSPGRRGVRGMMEEHGGTYHLTARRQTTCYQFSRAIVESCRTKPELMPRIPALKGNSLKVKQIVPISTREFPTPARRPAYSVLDNSKFSETLKLALPDWQAQLEWTLQDQAADPILRTDCARERQLCKHGSGSPNSTGHRPDGTLQSQRGYGPMSCRRFV